MRRVPILVAALVVPVLPVVAAPSGHAAGENIICVGVADVTCVDTPSTIQEAITIANGNGVADIIWVGAGTYSDGPYVLNGATHDLILQGSGPQTVITLGSNASSQNYVTANGATVRDLAIELNPTDSSNDKAIYAYDGAVVDGVTVDGTTAANTTGIQIRNSQVVGSTITMPLSSGSRGFFAEGGATVTDTTITADTGFAHSGTGTPDTVSRTTIEVGSANGVTTDSGTVNVDNTVIDLNTSTGTGLRAANFNNSTSPRSIGADHVTIVGGGAGSEGVWAYAATAGALQTTTVSLTNSIVDGPARSLVVDAGNNGSQGGPSTATLSVDFSRFDPTTAEETVDPTTGAGGIVDGLGNVDFDPAFADAGAGDLRLAEGSPLIDQGDPAAGLPGDLDRDGNNREVDGDGDATVRRDMGAYEFADLVAPPITITAGPAGATRDTTPTFSFTSEPDATFSCQVDAGPYGACTSPFTAAALANGTHTFRVRATDAWANTSVAATRSFKVDTVAPDTTFTKKPGKEITKRRARFAFASTEAGSRFQCRLDKGAWTSCTSPKVVRVKKGKHVFRVRAIDATGNVDATPATYRFRRL